MKGRESREDLRFRLREEAAIEDFGERSLVLLCDALCLREINGASRRMLALLDGTRTVKDIAALLLPSCGEPGTVAEALLRMEEQGIVRRVVEWSTERPERMSEAIYLRNPDVSFRQEGDDGGILYNADTDSLEVLNPTAAAIWSFLSAPRTPAEVAGHLCEVCEGASRAQVEKDVAEFIASMVEKGFIGVVKGPA